MDLWIDDPNRKGDLMHFQNVSNDPFEVQYNSQLTVIPPGMVVRVPRSHYAHLMQSPGASKHLKIIEGNAGSQAFRESERARKEKEIADRKAEIARLNSEITDLTTDPLPSGLKEIDPPPAPTAPAAPPPAAPPAPPETPWTKKKA